MRFTLQKAKEPVSAIYENCYPLELWLDGVKLPVSIDSIDGDITFGQYISLKIYMEHVDLAGPGYEMPAEAFVQHSAK